ESVAMHTTTFVPPGNSDPEAGEQLKFTGGVPPFGIGDPNVTATGSPSGDCPSTGAGQVRVRRFACGGLVGLEPQATSEDNADTTTASTAGRPYQDAINEDRLTARPPRSVRGRAGRGERRSETIEHSTTMLYQCNV